MGDISVSPPDLFSTFIYHFLSLTCRKYIIIREKVSLALWLLVTFDHQRAPQQIRGKEESVSSLLFISWLLHLRQIFPCQRKESQKEGRPNFMFNRHALCVFPCLGHSAALGISLLSSKVKRLSQRSNAFVSRTKILGNTYFLIIIHFNVCYYYVL